MKSSDIQLIHFPQPAQSRISRQARPASCQKSLQKLVGTHLLNVVSIPALLRL
ncbi:MAG: hypothetical protein ACKO0V_05795 [bacterium]